MSASAGIVVTGTEVLTGRVADANGPWLAEKLRSAGVGVDQVVVVGDRPSDLHAALAYLRGRCDLVITTGGLGPTADDLTTEVVAAAQGRRLVDDEDLAGRIRVIVRRFAAARGWEGAAQELEAGVLKQARVPEGAHILEPTGTAPGVVVPATDGGAPVLVLPGPPAELRAMWPTALADPLVQEAVAGRTELREETVRIWGPPEAELAAVLSTHADTHDLSGLEISTCLRDGALEVVARYSPTSTMTAAYADLLTALRTAFGTQIYSTDERDIDELLAAQLLASQASVATAESCTAGLLAGRLTDLAGSSAYVRGGFVTYANDAKTNSVGVPADLLADVGAVSEEVAVAMAHGARERLDATYGLSTTGVAGPGGGSAAKPVGLVHVAIAWEGGHRHARLQLNGDRAHVRARTVVTVLHLLRETLSART